ncbi:B3 domain-containing protein Os06g0194400 [Physcomitrium patens]|uniref:TF-B3 domain-containing protein n=1 Tax=Physcomitrium patens TaxID=3218 RepID=A0A2K1ISA4_PHYPA|nr:B3 domain-containing protein Os06g0194400-like [Physcomitrium patens]PNR32138.1 hypothetical protein PHYPA_026263 [Physcomitrium patens]|eukprot:XP_024358852.1 B3 domain-containing protein Os06g0194400-like [Physcomitrella patens]
MAVDKKAPALSYEEERKQRVMENKRIMQELGLVDLSNELKKLKKDSAKKPVKRKMLVQDVAGLESRRSSRVAAKPAVSYRDQLDLLPGFRARSGTGGERQGLPRRYLSDTVRLATIEMAEEAFKAIKNPGFVKAMLHSHVSSCFWLGLPHHFCKKHMPYEDERFTLEDEDGKEWECLYLARKTGLSGGWRGFSLDHDLVDGDCCIFELVRPLRFKIYFFRCSEQEDRAEDVEEKRSAVKAESKKAMTEKKASKAVTKKKPGFFEARKSNKSASKKLEVTDEEDDEYQSPKRSVNHDDSYVVVASRASSRKRVEHEDDVGKCLTPPRKHYKGTKSNHLKGNQADNPIDQESVQNEVDEKGSGESAAVTKTNQAGLGLSSGRVTRNSSRRSLGTS